MPTSTLWTGSISLPSATLPFPLIFFVSFSREQICTGIFAFGISSRVGFLSTTTGFTWICAPSLSDWSTFLYSALYSFFSILFSWEWRPSIMIEVLRWVFLDNTEHLSLLHSFKLASLIKDVVLIDIAFDLSQFYPLTPVNIKKIHK